MYNNQSKYSRDNWERLSQSERKHINWNSLIQADKNQIRENLISEQHGLCALCGEPFNYSTRHVNTVEFSSGKFRAANRPGFFPDNPVLDHDHKTGKIRGVLHSRCNLALQVIEDSGKHWICGAREYLSRYSKVDRNQRDWNSLTQADKNLIRGKLLCEQNGVCALCGESLEKKFLTYIKNSIVFVSDHPVLDHDHKTGKIRGVLHSRCNLALEVIENSGEHWMDGAREYLSRNGKDVIF